MQNFIVILIVAVIVGLASRYIYKEKKRGVKCIGCPDSVKRSGNYSGCSGLCRNCGSNDAEYVTLLTKKVVAAQPLFLIDGHWEYKHLTCQFFK